MSALIVGVLKFTVGLLSKKVCSYSASRLKNGGITDQTFRDLIVSELDDMKSKLKDHALRELNFGISCLKVGIERLNTSFVDSIDASGLCQSKKDLLTSKSMEPCSDSMPGRDQVLTYAHAIGKLDGVSSKGYECAVKSFENAADNAGKAFHNHTLNLEERMLACKVRIVSAILQHLTHPAFAVTDCKVYLKELHELSEIIEVFTVHAKGGFKTLVIRREKRAEVVESVMKINLFVLDFITTIIKKDRLEAPNLFEWPLIKCDTSAYHPIYYEACAMAMMNELTKITPPWCMELRGLLHYGGISAVNSRGDIILWPDPTKLSLAKLDRETREMHPIAIPALAESIRTDEAVKCSYLAVDEEDTVYFLARYGHDSRYNLSVCDNNGNIRCHHLLEFLNGKECRSFGITEDKRLVFCCEYKQNMYSVDPLVLYICNSNGQLKDSFPAQIPANQVVNDIFSSNGDEVVLVVVKKLDKNSSTIVLYIYSVDKSHLKRTVELTLPSGSRPPSSCNVRYNYLRNCFMCLTRTIMGAACRYLQYCAETGKLEISCDMNIKHLGFNQPNLCSHPKGSVAMVCQNGVLYM